MDKIKKLLIERTKDNKDVINDQIAVYQKDPNHKFNKLKNIGRVIEVMNQSVKVIGDNKLTFSQNDYYNSLQGVGTLWVNAPTGFGKTWVSSTFYKEKKESCLHIVPNDILVTQGIISVGEGATSDFSIIDNNKYYFATPEKVYGALEKIKDEIYKFSKIFVDEAHIMADLNDGRASFYRYIVSQINNVIDKRHQQIIMLSPFLTPKKIKYIREQTGLEFQNLKEYKGFESQYLLQNPKTNKYLTGNEEIEFPAFDQKEGLDLYYFNSVPKARQNFKKAFKDSRNVKNLNDNERIREYISENIEDVINENYDAYFALRRGVALYHSNMPISVKKLVFLAAKEGVVDKLYSTSAILNGSDLPIRKLVITSVTNSLKKTKNQEMSVDDFFNLVGRSGRYRPKKDQLLARVEFTKDEKNLNWFTNNKKDILNNKRDRDSTFTDEAATGHYTDMSRKAAKDDISHASYYLADPRINPKVTKILFENPTLIVNYKTKILDLITYAKLERNWNSIGQKLIWTEAVNFSQNFEEMLNLYELSRPKGALKMGDLTTLFKEDPAKNVFKAAWYLVKYFSTYSEEQIVKSISKNVFKKNNDENSLYFEREYGVFKRNVKFQLLMYFNHIFELDKIYSGSKYNLYDIIEYRTKDTGLITYIKNSNKQNEYFDFIKSKPKKINMEMFKNYLKK